MLGVIQTRQKLLYLKLVTKQLPPFECYFLTREREVETNIYISSETTYLV